MPRPRSPLLLLAAALLAACGSDPAGPGPWGLWVTVSVDSTPTLSRPDVHFTVENRSADTVYLARCGDRIMAAVDRREAGRWEAHGSDACSAVLARAPLALAPGERAAGLLAVQIPGRYRLRLGAARGPGEAPAWDVASPAFDVTT